MALLIVFFTIASPSDAQNAAGTASIVGTIIDQDGGTAISGANVALYQGDRKVASTKSTGSGFTFSGLPGGLYYVTIDSLGYVSLRSEDIALVDGATAQSRNILVRARSGGNASDLRQIGRVSSSALGGNGKLSKSTTINADVPSAVIQSQGYTRIGDALANLPGVNTTGISSSVGDDLGVDIRGFGSDETETLLDGHPIGPQGVGAGGFGYQLSPSYAIANTQVTYGSGALGLYGSDSIGGTVDFQTLEPSAANHFQVQQGIGYEGRRFTALQATGSVAKGKLGYAFVHAVDGTYGPWPVQARLQPGLLSSNFSPANLALNTYVTSGNYKLNNDLYKLRYAFSNATKVELATYSAQSWDDKTGNGDNCYFNEGISLTRALAAANANGSGPNYFLVTDTSGNALGPQTGPPDSSGVSTGAPCPAGKVGATLDNKTFSCVSPQFYADHSAGLAGGGPGPYQAHRFNDYHGRITTQLGKSTFIIDGFGNRYSTDYNRYQQDQSANADYFDTTGLLLADDIVLEHDDLGFGYFVDHQRHTGKFLQATYPGTVIGADTIPGQEYALGNRNFFVRDQFTPPGPFSVFLNAFLKRSTVTQKQTLDPRLSFIYRLTSEDVLRLTGGRSDGPPSPENVTGQVSLNLTPSNITPTCTGNPKLTGIGSSVNPGLLPETSTDYELAYGHRFKADDVIQADAYFAFEKNRIFSGLLPISQYPGGVVIAPSLLSAILGRINSFCGVTNASPAELALSAPVNAAASRYQGIEISGRHRLTPKLFLDYGYNVQSAVNLGVPENVLMNNVTLINGSQIGGVPLQKASAGLDFDNRHGFEARVDSYFQGAYNPYNRDPFFYSNASLTQTFRNGTTLNIGVQNLFDSAASQLLVYGTGPFQGENQFGTDRSPADFYSSQNIGQTGILPITAVLTITQRI